MWIVVYKQDYYPSVLEFTTEEEARKRYDKIKKEHFRDDSYLEDAKLYIGEIKDSHGLMDKDVEWYILSTDEEEYFNGHKKTI
jgi:hypothetical protein